MVFTWVRVVFACKNSSCWVAWGDVAGWWLMHSVDYIQELPLILSMLSFIWRNYRLFWQLWRKVCACLVAMQVRVCLLHDYIFALVGTQYLLCWSVFARCRLLKRSLQSRGACERVKETNVWAKTDSMRQESVAPTNQETWFLQWSSEGYVSVNNLWQFRNFWYTFELSLNLCKNT